MFDSISLLKELLSPWENTHSVARSSFRRKLPQVVVFLISNPNDESYLVHQPTRGRDARCNKASSRQPHLARSTGRQVPVPPVELPVGSALCVPGRRISASTEPRINNLLAPTRNAFAILGIGRSCFGTVRGRLKVWAVNRAPQGATIPGFSL